MKAHSRKISDSLKQSWSGYQTIGGTGGSRENGTGSEVAREDSKYEMRALMDPSRTQVTGKMSGESFSVGGSEMGEDRDKDSAKAMGVKF